MKIFSVIGILLFAYFSVFSQETFVHGVLYEHNSKTNSGALKPISNAQILITKSVPCTSDNTGKFKTRLDGYQYGQTAQISVRKPGYEVVNVKELENYLVGARDEVKIFLAPQNMLYEAQMKYYNIAKKSIDAGYNEKLSRLTSELKNFESLKLNSQEDIQNFNQEFQRKSKEIENQRKTALKSADGIAKRIAEINLDFAEKTYKQAVDFFVMGNIDSCLVLLNSKYFFDETNKTLSKIGDLKNSIKDEVNNVERIIDREIFRAQLYQTKFQLDSVSLILQRISVMSFKLIESLDVALFVDIQKRVIDFDPFYNFSWINNEYFEDLVSLVRIKGGRGSYMEAEAIRLFGVYKMRTGDNENSLSLLLKSLKMLNNIKGSDSVIVLANLMEHGNLYQPNQKSDDLIFYGNGGPNEYRGNPYWFKEIFKDPSAIEYGVKVILNRYESTGNSFIVIEIVDNALRYLLRGDVKRNYNKAFLDFLKLKKVQNYASRNNGLLLKHIEDIIEMDSQINISSIDYVNQMYIVAPLYFDEVFQIQNRIEDYDSIIFSHVSKFYSEYSSNEYLNSLNGEKKLQYEISRMMLSMILWKAKSELVSVDQIVSDFDQLQSIYNAFLNSAQIGVVADNIYFIYRIRQKIYGCYSYEDQIALLSTAESMSKGMIEANVFGGNGMLFNKYVLESSFNCEDSLSKKIEVIGHLEDLIKNSFDEFYNDSTYSGRGSYGVIFSPDFSGSDSGFHYMNYVEEFYYGSDYAKKIGRNGLVKRLNGFDVSSRNCLSKSDSLFQEHTRLVLSGQIDRNDASWRVRLNQCSLTAEMSNSAVIDSMQFVDSETNWKKIERIVNTPAFYVWANFGNSQLDGLDFIFFKISYLSLLKGDYKKCIDNLYRFIKLGMPEYVVGYSKCYGTVNAWLSFVYLWGIRSAILLDDERAYEYFTSSFNNFYCEMSPKNKVLLLNEMFWNVFEQRDFIVNGKSIRINYNTAFFKDKYSDFCNINSSDSQLRVANNSREDFLFDIKMESNILENYLTLSLLIDMDNFDSDVFNTMKIKYPKEPRVFRNAAYYHFKKGEQKLAFIELDKAISLGLRSPKFFTERAELSKYHSKIIEKFVGISDE